MSGIHLKDLSKVYKEQIAEKKDDSYLETDMKKRQKNNEKARKDMKKMGSMSNPHFGDGPTGSMSSEEVEVTEADSLAAMQARREKRLAAQRKKMGTSSTGQDFGHDYGISSAERKKRQQAEFDKFVGKKTQKEGLDPVGKEDGDVNNDGKKDSTDSYLMKRRKAIGKAIKSKMSEGVRDMDPEKGTAERKARLEKKRGMKMDDHPEYKKEEYIPEVMTDSMDEKPIKEKKVKNIVKINPKMGESVEEIGGELIEAVEIFDILEEITDEELRFISDKMINEVVEEFFAEAVEKDEDLEVLQQNLCESIDLSISILLEQDAGAEARKRLMSRPSRASVMDRVKSAVKKTGKAVARGAGYAAGAAVRGAKAAGREFSKGYERGSTGSSGSSDSSSSNSDSSSSSAPKKKGPGMLSRIGAKLKRGIGKAARAVSRGARNVARKMDEAVYGGTPAKKEAPKDNRMVVTAADKKGNTPAYQRYKAGDKRYKAADHMGEEMSPQEIQMQKKKATLDKMIAMKRKQQLDKTKAEPVKAMGEEASDAMKDRRMERGGVAGNQRYDRPAKGVKTGPMSDAEKKKSREASSRAMDFVRASITSKYGKGAIIDTKKK
tara:strand:+ start:377 stop:2194 length:1818 start_codon:yes stop_codon:yes gene_type:complete